MSENKNDKLNTQLLALTVLATNIALQVQRKQFVPNSDNAVQIRIEGYQAAPLYGLLEDLIKQVKAANTGIDDASLAKAEFLVQAGLHGKTDKATWERANADISPDTIASILARASHLANQRPSPKIGFTANPDVSTN